MTEKDPERPSSTEGPRYKHPKILAIDLGEGGVEAIRAGGFNVKAGSFGTPISLPRSEDHYAVPFNGSLPNVTEQEIVVIDLAAPAPRDDLEPGEKPVGPGTWQELDSGVLDPRPHTMRMSAEYFGRIYDHGGIFVIFADRRVTQRYVFGEDRRLMYGDKISVDNWSFLSALSGLAVTGDFGEEVTVNEPILPGISSAIEKTATFTCLVEPEDWVEDRWVALATNKYGRPVAGVLVPEKDSGAGVIFVLPRLGEKGALIRALLEDYFPQIRPQLFPEDERRIWVADDAYAPPGIAEIQRKIATVRQRAIEEERQFQTQIEDLQAASAHLHDLLTCTGDDLVAAVKTTLESIGFADVRDVDEEEGAKDGRLREDLQIFLNSPVVLVEVKGISGLPRDGDALQVVKNILPRVKEWDRTDIRGLSVINHQRGLPPVDRNEGPFAKSQIENAEGQDIGLLTTWDLYRLARGFESNSWPPEAVTEVIANTKGRIEAVPAHYTLIGHVENYYEEPGAVIVELAGEWEIRKGDTIAYGLPIDFIEEVVTSIKVNDETVEISPRAGCIGLKTALTKDQARKKSPVYLVSAGEGRLEGR